MKDLETPKGVIQLYVQANAMLCSLFVNVNKSCKIFGFTHSLRVVGGPLFLSDQKLLCRFIIQMERVSSSVKVHTFNNSYLPRVFPLPPFQSNCTEILPFHIKFNRICEYSKLDRLTICFVKYLTLSNY